MTAKAVTHYRCCFCGGTLWLYSHMGEAWLDAALAVHEATCEKRPTPPDSLEWSRAGAKLAFAAYPSENKNSGVSGA